MSEVETNIINEDGKLTVRVGDLVSIEVNTYRGEVVIYGAENSMTDLEFSRSQASILRTLLLNIGSIVSKDQLKLQVGTNITDFPTTLRAMKVKLKVLEQFDIQCRIEIRDSNTYSLSFTRLHQ